MSTILIVVLIYHLHKPIEVVHQILHFLVTCVHQVYCLLVILFDSEDGDHVFIRNAGKF
jgi:hypothetical protein